MTGPYTIHMIPGAVEPFLLWVGQYYNYYTNFSKVQEYNLKILGSS